MKFNHLVNNIEYKFPKGSLKIADYDPETIIHKIRSNLQIIYQQINNNEIPNIEIPLLKFENIIYDTNNNLYLGSMKKKLFLEKEEFIHIVARCKLLIEILSRGINSTKRDLFYSNILMFSKIQIIPQFP